MREQIQSGMAVFVSHFLPSIHARIKRLETDMPSSQREQLWEQRISRLGAQLSAQGKLKHEVFPPRSHSPVLVSESGIPRTYATVLNTPLPTQRGRSAIFGGAITCFTTTVEFSEAHSRRSHLRDTKHCSNRFWRGRGVDYRGQGSQHNGSYTPTSIFARNFADLHQASVFW